MRPSIASRIRWPFISPGAVGAGGGILYIAFIILPVAALLVRAAQQDGFLDSLTSGPAMTALRLSFITSAMSMTVVLLAGTPFAYLMARGNSRWLGVVDALVQLPMLLPPVVAGLALLMAFGRRGILGPGLEDAGITIPFTTLAVVLAQIFVAAPFYIRSAKFGFQSVSKDYEDISQTLGISPWMTFWRLSLPLAAPAIIAGLGLAWARALAEFGATLMFAGNLPGETQTMPLAIMTAMERSLDTALAMAVLLLVAAMVMLLALGLLTKHRWQGHL